MNIDEYREMKAEMEKEQADETGGVDNAQVEQSTAVTPEQSPQETEQVQPSQEPAPEQVPNGQTEVPSTIKYGETEYEVESLIQAKQEAEILRQQQAQVQSQLQQAQVAQQYYAKLMENPDYAKAFAQNNGLTYVDPKEQAVQELQSRYNQMLLEREIENMQIKHKDFNPQEVVKFAYDKGIGNLEDAYILMNARNGGKQENPDMASIREQIRQEVQNELKSSVNTGSLIGGSGGGGKPIQSSAPELSSQEIKVARGLGLSPKEYAFYKNKK